MIFWGRMESDKARGSDGRILPANEANDVNRFFVAGNRLKPGLQTWWRAAECIRVQSVCWGV